MSDIIQLLPDSVANQIAAGEVIQRPASAVKELMENALDSGATDIKLIVKDAGRTLIQVIDNGKGMSETDARMSFERHATSKIKKAEDLFSIRTMGFRGEALASIAAIAQVELKTKLRGQDIGSLIEIEASAVKSQSACSCPEGTSIAMKNLFFNVPARRNFLKSDAAEFRHILEEFQREVLPNPGIAFSLHHNNTEVFHLLPGTLRQRISAVFASNYNERLVPVDESTDILKITGFVIKPEFAKKTRGEQYFFINHRFIKNSYLHHAVQSAYKDLLASDSFSSYFLLMELNPKTIDINIHPTKTEIKFEDERTIYMILHSSVKRALGKHNIAPTLDFEQETSFNIPALPKGTVVAAPQIQINPDYNPFANESKRSAPTENFKSTSNKQNWEKLYEGFNNNEDGTTHPTPQKQLISEEEEKIEIQQRNFFQLHNKYIVAAIKSGFVVIDQQGAHERILYERYLTFLEKNKSNSQQLLFPQTISFTPADFELLMQLKTDVRAIGFDMADFGKNTFVIHGVPAEIQNENLQQVLENIIEQYKQNQLEVKANKKEVVAKIMARSASIKSGKTLHTEEIKNLIDELFACKMPYSTASGKPTVMTFSSDELDKKFKK